MKKRLGFRQGDILFRPTENVTGEAMAPVKGRHTIAEGEHTGHSHTIKDTPNIAVLLSPEGMNVTGTGSLVHQQHTSQRIEGGYEVVQQRRAGADDHQTIVAYD